MKKKIYSNEFKESVLKKVRERGSRTLQELATELNLSFGTLKGWIKQSATQSGMSELPRDLPQDRPAHQWSAAERLLALNASHALQGPALSAWCREKGLFEHQLAAWRAAFCAGVEPAAAAGAKTQLKALQHEHEKLQRELRRKERALAEAAALLVLQKKFQALLAGEA